MGSTDQTEPDAPATLTFSSMSALHPLLLLSDSALPLGSFAFSSGLESYLAHAKLARTPAPFAPFLHTSLSNLAATTLPHVLHAHAEPSDLLTLDNDLDAATPCSVARRASISQGKALLAIWERSLRAAAHPSTPTQEAAIIALADFALRCKRPAGTTKAPTTDDDVFSDLEITHAHLPPLFGCVASALALPAAETAYVYLLNHAKALLSAAVRASVLGPYAAQALLAGTELREGIERCVRREWGREVVDAAVRAPVMDLWVGRHECLYSRIFNS